MMYLGNNPVGLATSIPTFAQFGKVEMGEYTPETDIKWSEVRFNHSLGAVPDFIVFYSDKIDITTSYNTSYLVSTSVVRRKANSASDSLGNVCVTRIGEAGVNHGRGGLFFNGTYVASDTYFYAVGSSMGYADESRLKANTTYHYIVGKFKEVT